MVLALKDLKANESRLKDINKVAEDLESEGLMAEEVQAAQQQASVRAGTEAVLLAGSSLLLVPS